MLKYAFNFYKSTKWPPRELSILTKCHKNWTKIVDFLLKAYFSMCLIFLFSFFFFFWPRPYWWPFLRYLRIGAFCKNNHGNPDHLCNIPIPHTIYESINLSPPESQPHVHLWKQTQGSTWEYHQKIWIALTLPKLSISLNKLRRGWIEMLRNF